MSCFVIGRFLLPHSYTQIEGNFTAAAKKIQKMPERISPFNRKGKSFRLSAVKTFPK
nr:MAG TPA: LYSR-TYPE REGULATORY PROTEIN, LYSR-TYPE TRANSCRIPTION REGULATORS, LTTR [Caudoviricetes sp.]